MSLQSDIDRSAAVTDDWLNKVWWRLFGRTGKRQPKTYLDRNGDIYAELGHIPRREA